MISTNFNINNSCIFRARNNNHKIKPIFIEDYYDEFVSSIIKKEKESNNGQISQYKDFLTKQETKRFKKDLKGAVGTLVINNNLHIIKQGETSNKFIDIVKKLFKS